MNARILMLACAASSWIGVATPVFAADALDEVAGVRRVCAEGPDSAVARAQRNRGAQRLRLSSLEQVQRARLRRVCLPFPPHVERIGSSTGRVIRRDAHLDR